MCPFETHLNLVRVLLRLRETNAFAYVRSPLRHSYNPRIALQRKTQSASLLSGIRQNLTCGLACHPKNIRFQVKRVIGKKKKYS